MNEKKETIEDIEDTSDGYHTFRELYRYRMLYNAAFFNMLSRHTSIPVVKSHRHGDGELCFGGGWFIVMAQLPTGQVSNHYEDRYWGLFCVPEAETAPEWDGHTPNDAADRLESFLAMREPDSDRSNPPGNAAAMREALRKIRDKCVIYNNDLAEEIDALCGNALAAPARNCDKYGIDNIKKMDADFGAFCRQHGAKDGENCVGCPIKPMDNLCCHSAWMLLPAEGGAERSTNEGDAK